MTDRAIESPPVTEHRVPRSTQMIKMSSFNLTDLTMMKSRLESGGLVRMEDPSEELAGREGLSLIKRVKPSLLSFQLQPVQRRHCHARQGRGIRRSIPRSGRAPNRDLRCHMQTKTAATDETVTSFA